MGKGEGCVDPSEVSNSHTQLLLSLAHSTHTTQPLLLKKTTYFYLCMSVFVQVSACLVLRVSQ